MADAPDPVRVALYNTLVADIDLMGMLAQGENSIFYAQADEKLDDTTELPILIYFKMPGSRMRTFGDKNPIRWNNWVVKAVGNRNVVDGISARLCQVLNNADITPTEGSVLDIFENGDVEETETINGERYDHVGHFFRVASERT